MSRPIYETPSDLQNEIEVIDFLKKKWRSGAVKFPGVSRNDWLFYRGWQAKALAEVKCRKKQYDPYMVSLTKVRNLLWVGGKLNIPVYLVVRWPEGVFSWECDLGEVERVGEGGRTDRGDPKDIEEMAFIRVSEFWKTVGFRVLENGLK